MNKHNEGYRSGEHHWFMTLDQFSDGTMPEISRCAPFLQLELNSEPIQAYVANDEEWEAFKTKFNKIYSQEEENLKYALFPNVGFGTL